MKSLRKSLAAFAAVSLMAVAALAADPSGTYTFASFGRGGGGGGGAPAPDAPRPMATLVLELKDGKLTGNVTAPGRGGEMMKTDISEASFKDDTVTFVTKVQGQNGERITKYTGKLSADAITGTVLAPGRGDAAPMPRDWVAKKSAK